MNIKKGDNVLILKGKDRGKKGKVSQVIPETNKVIINGLNQFKKAVRPKKEGEKGQIILVSSPINRSNISVVCSGCGKATRIGIKQEGKTKQRYCKKCKATI